MRGLLRAEGVNFASTLFDTNDLSTIRGASLALGRLHEAVEIGLRKAGATAIREEFAGASQCLFSFDIADPFETAVAAVRAVLSDAKAHDAPFAHLAIMVDAAPLPDGSPNARAACEQLLTARNRAQQLRTFAVPPVPFSSERRSPDPLDGILPGTIETHWPKGKILDSDARGDEDHRLAPSVAARRDYGRKMRTKFYEGEVGARANGLRVTNSLEAMVEDPPPGLPVSVAGKIAVVYADGNQFGKQRQRMGSKPFADALAAFRKTLLGHVVDWLQQDGDDPAFMLLDDRGRRAVRFETLIYGGDELTVAMPAWLAASFVEGFFEATRAWTVDGHRLTHAMGVAIANAKSPIRQLREVAANAADAAKDAGMREIDSVSFEIFESLAPPDISLEDVRTTLYGDDPEILAEFLPLPGDRFAPSRKIIARLKGEDGSEGFPRSQIYAALRSVRRKRLSLLSGAADCAVRKALDTYAKRAGAGKEVRHTELKLPCAEGSRPWALDLALIASLWDYANPLAGRKARELSSFIS